MKKILSLVLAFILVMSLPLCAYGKSAEAKEVEKKATPVGEATADSRDAYEKAASLYDSGEYAQALEMFEALGDYEDSADKVKACSYQVALELTKAENYQEALDMFLSLGDYEDCAEQSFFCSCNLAEAYAEDGKLTEAVNLLTDYSSYPKAQELLFVFFSDEVTDVYMENFQDALDSWNEYVPIWTKVFYDGAAKIPAGGTVPIPKVDKSAPQVIALQRSMKKANKSVEKLREAYNEEVLQICNEDIQNVINTFFAFADIADQQFEDLDSWIATLLYYTIQEHNGAKANNRIMNAAYNVQDALDELMEKYG